MRANYVGNTALQERLHRPSPEVRAIVEAVVVSQQDTRETNDDWTGSGSLFFPEIGGAKLLRDTSATHATHDTASGDQENVTTDLDNDSPWFMLELEWTDTDAPDFEIHSFTTTIDPDVDGTGREVSELRCQVYRVATESENEYVLEPISGRATAAVTGNAQSDFSFDLSGGEVGEPPEPGDSPESEDDFDPPTNPITIVKVWAVDSDGNAAGNIAWVGDNDDSASGTTVVDGGGLNAASARFRELRSVDDARRISSGGRFEKFGVGSGIPDFSLDGQTYAQATATFTGIDMGSAPASDTDIVVVAQGEEPSDSSLTWEISDDSGSTWTEVVDGDVVGEDNTGDGGNDLSSVSRQQTYDMRVTLDPSSDGHTSPFARRIGVEELTATNLDKIATVDAGNWGFDPVTLVGEIPEATIRIEKDGLRDYRSEGERLFADNHIGDMTFRVWIGHPDLDRKNWLLVDAFEVDDYSSEGADIKVTGLSPLRRLKTAIPPYDTGANERVPVEYTNQTLKAAWDDLIDSQVALPARFRGPGVEDTSSQSVSKTLRDSDGKTELDAIAHLAGGTVVTSQGRVKYQPTFLEDRGGVRASFPREEIDVVNVTPGYRNRVEEYFVSYAYDADRDDFDGEVRSFYPPSIANLGGKGLDMPEELDADVARWLPTPNDTSSQDPSQSLAGYVGHRTASSEGLGPGLKQVRFRPTIPRPELEPGDAVVVETDQLVIKRPSDGTAFRGVLWLTGVVQVQHDVWGREFTVWVQQIEDATPSEEDTDRDTATAGAADITFSEDRSAGNATVTVDITGPGSYDVFIYRMDTDGTETQVDSQTGVTDGGGNDPVTHTESLRESEVLPLRAEVLSSTGKLVQADTATLDADEIADTSLSVHIQDDGTPVARGRMDLDGTGGVVHLTTATGSSPTASDPTGSENTVNLSAGERSWEHTFSGVTVANGDEISVKARPETAGGDVAPTDRITEVVVPRTRKDSLQNLLGPDAGPESSFTSFQEPHGTPTNPGTDLTDMGVEVGDTISLSADLKSDTGSDLVSLRLQYFDSGGSFLSEDTSTLQTTSAYTRHVVENSTIPANTASITVRARNHDQTETAYIRRAMLNRGPVAVDFTPPVGPFSPEVDAQTSQSGSTGTLDLSIYDPGQSITAVEFQKKTDSGDFSGSWSTAWDSSSGTAGSTTSLTRSESISLKKKHNVAIKWRVTYTDTDGNSQTIANTHEFDVDTVPEVTEFSGSVDGSLNILTSGLADEDTATVYVTVTTDGTEPNDPTSSNADETIDVSTDKVWGAVDTDVDASFGDVVRMKARGEDAGTNLAGTDHIADFSFKVDKPDPPSIELFQVVSYSVGACNNALDIELEWLIGSFDSANFSLTLELYADWDDDGVFEKKSTETPSTQQGDTTASADHYTWADLPYKTDGTCSPRNIYIKLVVTRDSTGESVDNADTAQIRDNWYLCLDGQCASASGLE